ncbi:MAG: hypothetical protein HZB56_03365 [Deltaproteobacteria bacterium]|nr:hypothetical protein [Deltaproteobacteria bacterium]
MSVRRADAFLALLLALAALGAAAAAHARAQARRLLPEQEARAELVRRLDLTDLCLFTEARYTRHPSQADRFAAFQDHPVALEHFPSGSLVPPRR